MKQHSKPANKPASRRQIEMLDGRVYYSDDNWEHVWQARKGAGYLTDRHITDKAEADTVRLCVAHGASS
jgi:hypothetical protein